MDKKQTAIDFLWTKASSGEHLTPEDFDQAKAMEMEQIIDAYDSGLFDGTMDDVKDRIYTQYYNETFKSE